MGEYSTNLVTLVQSDSLLSPRHAWQSRQVMPQWTMSKWLLTKKSGRCYDHILGETIWRLSQKPML
jgi:hypothetical protein